MVAFFGFGAWVSYNYLQSTQTKEYIESDSSVILEKVEHVCKMVTVEGHFEERYDQTNIKEFNLYLPLPSKFKFSKSARIRVIGTVLVGYDMDKITVQADSLNQEIRMSNFPEPEIIAIDHTVEYEDIEDSWFNTFSAADFTLINQNARKVLEETALEELLLEKAKDEGIQIVDAIEFMVKAAGWNLVIDYENAANTSDIH